MNLLTCLVLCFAVTSVLTQKRKFKIEEWEQTPPRTIQYDYVVKWLSQSTKPPKTPKLEGALKCIDMLRQEDVKKHWFCRKKLTKVKNNNPYCTCFSNTNRRQVVRYLELE